MEGVRITVGFRVDGCGVGNTARAVLVALIPAPEAAADTDGWLDGWFTALAGDTAGTGVAAGVEGLEP